MLEGTLRESYGALTAVDVAALDVAASAAGIDVLQLMEVAGLQVARCAWEMLGGAPDDVAVLAGRGNNGGDGLVAARFLRAWGCDVVAVVAGDEGALRGVLVTQLRAARGAGVGVAVSGDVALARAAVAGRAVAVDALLGTGLRSAPRDPDAGFITALHGHPAVLAIDVPSGLDATSGEPFDPCVRAAVTCTLTACKAGLWSAAGRTAAGRLVVADIGMPATAWEAVGLAAPALLRGGALCVVPDG